MMKWSVPLTRNPDGSILFYYHGFNRIYSGAQTTLSEKTSMAQHESVLPGWEHLSLAGEGTDADGLFYLIFINHHNEQ